MAPEATYARAVGTPFNRARGCVRRGGVGGHDLRLRLDARRPVPRQARLPARAERGGRKKEREGLRKRKERTEGRMHEEHAEESQTKERTTGGKNERTTWMKQRKTEGRTEERNSPSVRPSPPALARRWRNWWRSSAAVRTCCAAGCAPSRLSRRTRPASSSAQRERGTWLEGC